jgi:PEP-CTERM motif-containing protein
MKALLLAASMIAIAASTPASGAITELDFQFSATTPGPITSHSGTFTLLHDDVAGTITLSEINFSLGATSFTTANTSAFQGLGSGIGGNTNGPGGLSAGTDDFTLSFFSPFVLDGASFAYTLTTEPFIITATQVSLSRVVPGGAIPEPTSWAMMLLGFGAVGLAIRRRRAIARACLAKARSVTTVCFSPVAGEDSESLASSEA